MSKSPDAFRTISEVADWLGVQAHVLRFWESKFAQVKPIKRAGGRRYYRPNDMLLLGGIKKLLHDDGLTIKGAQKVLRENGVSFVADQSQPLDALTMAVIEGSTQSEEAEAEDIAAAELALLDAPFDIEDQHSAVEETEDAAEDPDAPELPFEAPDPVATEASADTSEDAEIDPQAAIAEPEASEPQMDLTPDAAMVPETEDASAGAQPDAEPDPGSDETSDATEPPLPAPDEAPDDVPTAEDLGPAPAFKARARATPAELDATTSDAAPAPKTPESPAPTAEDPAETPAQEPPQPALAARNVVVPQVPAPEDISVEPSALTSLSKIRRISPEHAREIKPLLARLTRLHASMANPRKEQRKD